MKKNSKTITLQARRGAYRGPSINGLGYGETGIGIAQKGQYTKFFPDSKPGQIRFLLPKQFFTYETAKDKKTRPLSLWTGDGSLNALAEGHNTLNTQ